MSGHVGEVSKEWEEVKKCCIYSFSPTICSKEREQHFLTCLFAFLSRLPFIIPLLHITATVTPCVSVMPSLTSYTNARLEPSLPDHQGPGLSIVLISRTCQMGLCPSRSLCSQISCNLCRSWHQVCSLWHPHTCRELVLNKWLFNEFILWSLSV